MKKTDELDNSHALDLAARIPWKNMPEEKRKEVWDDGVHFTEKGYELMGNIVAKKLIATISAERDWDVEGGPSVDEKAELKRRDQHVEDTKAKSKRKVSFIEQLEQDLKTGGRQLRSGRILAA